MSADPRRTPILKGDVYCSPACGCRCTKAAYDAAVVAADKMVAQLGAGWESRVWENSGWYCSANKAGDGVFGGAAVYLQSDGKFWCTIAVTPQSSATADSPRKAFKQALRAAIDHIDKTTKILEALEK